MWVNNSEMFLKRPLPFSRCAGGIVIIPERGRFSSGGPLERPISKGFHPGAALQSEYAETEKSAEKRKTTGKKAEHNREWTNDGKG